MSNTSANFASLFAFSGAGKAKREQAFDAIPLRAMDETLSRADLIAHCKTAMGASPDDKVIAAIRTAVTIGRVAARLPKGEIPKEKHNDVLGFAFDLVTRYAAPPKDGAKPRALKSGQLGRRSQVQHRIVRNADESWYQLAAEIGIGKAKTNGERNQEKKTRSTNANPVRGEGKGDSSKPAAPSHAELVKPAKPLTAEEACNFVMSQASTLQSYANKYAKVLPADFGQAVTAFKSAINKAMNDLALRKAAADALKASQEK